MIRAEAAALQEAAAKRVAWAEKVSGVAALRQRAQGAVARAELEEALAARLLQQAKEIDALRHSLQLALYECAQLRKVVRRG